MVWISDEPKRHFAKSTIYTARKEHICYLCGKAIPIGQQYFSGVRRDYEGFHYLKYHLSCSQISRDTE